MKTCILVTTCEKYRWVAEFTRLRIAKLWQGHPSLFFCGIHYEGATPSLGLEENPADWMAIVKSSCEELLSLGFNQCYLILDDHPPMGECHHQHLNVTLPELLVKLDAVCIGLLGWGQGRSQDGTILNHYRMENTAEDYLWKFSLHPALWDLKKLSEILTLLMEEPHIDSRTPWKFERRSGSSETNIPVTYRKATYRISGEAMSARKSGRFFALLCKGERGAADVLNGVSRRILPQTICTKIKEKIFGLYHYYEGPYPLFWSGIMKKGKLNEDLLFFLKLHQQREFLNDLKHAKRTDDKG